MTRTIDQNDHNTKALAHQNSEQVHEPWHEPMVTNVHYISKYYNLQFSGKPSHPENETSKHPTFPNDLVDMRLEQDNHVLGFHHRNSKLVW